MLFPRPLLRARLLRRYKRFFVDFSTENGEVVAHCPNTGSLRGCLLEGAEAWLEPAADPARALRYTWKLIRVADTWVGVDTGLAVPLVREAITLGLLPTLTGFERCIPEVKYGRHGESRIDLLLSKGGTPIADGKKRRVVNERVLHVGDQRMYVEVKNTTLVEVAARGSSHEPHRATALFPDAVTERGQKHLRELIDVVADGHRAAMVFVVQRDDTQAFRPADAIDPAYGKLLRQAADAGVELHALAVRCTEQALLPLGTLPICLADSATVSR